ncbi:MAG: DUF5662 family protein [Clostridia bacterium]
MSKYSLQNLFRVQSIFRARSPNEKEELYGYSQAWLHHKGRNRHHYEYWNDYNPKTKQIENVEMPVKYVIEMFATELPQAKSTTAKLHGRRPFTCLLKSEANTVCTPTPRLCLKNCGYAER